MLLVVNKKDFEKYQRALLLQQHEADVKANQHRARSVTVGTAFGGVTELMMRKHDGSITWAVMQPVEVMELIHQLSANIGCHIHIQPRQDFGSWRSWKTETAEELERLGGHPPFVSNMDPHASRGRELPPPEKQPGFQPKLMNIDKQKKMLKNESREHLLSSPLDEEGLKANE